ncbi:MAG: sodium-dependent transporter, partial [Lentisphaeria bacterium]|nr:sodium-dependent transporter [Lentisphaeria bacterium]
LPKGSRFRWHIPGGVIFAGSAILMIYYTTVTGWLLASTWRYTTGAFAEVSSANAGKAFEGFISSAPASVPPMLIGVILATVVCFIGLRNGVERVTKILMGGLFALLLLLSIRSLFMPGVKEGLYFYLYPNFSSLTLSAIPAAMGQAFFTLSIGIGSIAIFGSYTGRESSLPGAGLHIIVLDTLVALLAGFIIFPACMSYDIDVNAGPGLIFVTLPAVFHQLPGGRVWGALFFLFLSVAAMTTVIAVFENLIAFLVDELHLSRKRASLLNGLVIAIGSLPCAFGFNLLKHIQPLGKGSTILDFEDYLVSDLLLPLGGLYLVIFCCYKVGWGWKNFMEEVNTGHGLKFPSWAYHYCKWIVPLLILFLFVLSIWQRWFK